VDRKINDELAPMLLNEMQKRNAAQDAEANAMTEVTTACQIICDGESFYSPLTVYNGIIN
jgi:hypothetical protein